MAAANKGPDAHDNSAASNYILYSSHKTNDVLSIENVNTLPDLFRLQAKLRDESTLFSFQNQSDAGITRISYADAYETSSRLANALRTICQRTSQKPAVVGIWLEKSIQLHLAILATTISSATWLPFDQDAPAARVRACLGDSDACVLLCDASHYDEAVKVVEGNPHCKVTSFEELSRLAEGSDGQTDTLQGPEAHDTAYMIYTSGSTGTPKGIEIPHRAALSFCLSERSVLETGPDDIVWQGFSPAFDMFIEEVWVSIAGGAHVAIGSRAECQDVSGLGGAGGVWAKRGVTLVNAVPTLINIMTSLDEEGGLPHSVRLLNLGGEACPPALVKRLWHSSLRIFNTYGPSETTVTSTFQELFPDEPVTIGKPLPMYHALVLPIEDDASSTRTPLLLRSGAEGELAIGGPCLGKGYVGRSSLTAEKFIAHPLPSQQGERLYRTGDRVRLDQNLNIIFLGRIDTQVKHRGFRIELGEIENAVSAHPCVQTAAVILSACTDRLEAYVVTKDDRAVDAKELRDQLHRLPSYMHPEAFFFTPAAEMPRLPSGKINVKALQDVSVRLALESKETQAAASRGDLPADDSELSLILRAMGEVFPQASDITPLSDFFDDLGGHSLTAAMLVSKLRKESADGSGLRSVGLKEVYIYRTAKKIAESVAVTDEKDGLLEDGHERLNTRVGSHWPVSPVRYWICGIAQVPALIFFFLVQFVALFAPYITFYAVHQISSLAYAIVATYLAFVIIPVFLTTLAICGKWATLGRARAGEYPLYGLYYYRWWLAEEFVNLVNIPVVADTALLPVVMRALGARVGIHCHISSLHIGAAFDLVSIGDDVVIGKDTALATSWIERGRLMLAPVSIASQVHVGSNSAIEGGSRIQEGGELGAMTMLPSDACVPAGERWIGSPARFDSYPADVGNMRASRPSFPRVAAMTFATSATSVFILPIISFLPQIPSILLFEFANLPVLNLWIQTAIVAVPSAIVYIFLVLSELVLLRWLVLGKARECSYRTTSFYFYRKWFVDRLMDQSLVILHPVYATLYVVPFLRLLGVKIGHMAEVSTARGINFELTDIGNESFIADRVLIGDVSVRANIVTLKKTKLNARAFAGNNSLIPQGMEMASNTLVGVMSVAPEIPLKEGQSCFGSPPVMMPSRQRGTSNHADHLLYTPRWTQVALRLFIEGMRIVVPRILIVFGLGVGIQVFDLVHTQLGLWPFLGLVPIIYFFLFAAPALLITLLFKWVLIGRYRPAEWPLWSVDVWKSEFVTATYETLVAPLLANMLTGTPFIAMVFRLFGVQVGQRTTLLTHDITEYDMVSLGDEAVLNRHCGPQTHLFEDRIMKIGRVEVEARGCMKTYSIGLPNSRVAAGAEVGCLSLVMKGETVPAGEAWEGAPIVPRRERQFVRDSGATSADERESAENSDSQDSKDGDADADADLDTPESFCTQ
ncbi:Non-ribosomal peptide synthetase C-terminal [Thozetella sp. PMI_491]|nr:Non-ribosomal peptide synthetase C-terminal [Thozetella sp. PMI_491]